MTDVRTLLPARPADLVADRAADGARVRMLLWIVVLVPLDVGWVLWAAPGAANDFNRRVTLAPFDLALVALTLTWLRARVATFRPPGHETPRRPSAPLPRLPRTFGVIVAAALGAAYLGSFVAHPSWRGVELTCRLIAGAAVVDTVRQASRSQLRQIAIATVSTAVVQSVLAIAQSINGRAFDLPPFNRAGPLFVFGDEHAGRGGLSHPYHLVVFLLLALVAALVGGRHDTGRARLLWCGALVVIGAASAVTFSRAMLLAAVPAGLSLVAVTPRLARGRTIRTFVLAFATGLTCGALVFASGWFARAEQSTAAGADRGRLDKARLGLEVASEVPLTGVGPGRYVIALAERGVPDVELLPTHNVVAHGLAELGIVGGTILAVALAAYAWRTGRRAGPIALAGAWLLAPFLLLDSYLYVFPTGLALTALWLGLLEHPELQRQSEI